MLAVAHPDHLNHYIVKQLANTKTGEYVRIHTGGEFFSAEYARRWASIRRSFPALTFYTYTKQGADIISILEANDINVVRSLTPDGKLNYGSLEYVTKLAEKYDGVICPITTGRLAHGYCGVACTHCMTRQHVFFVKH